MRRESLENRGILNLLRISQTNRKTNHFANRSPEEFAIDFR